MTFAPTSEQKEILSAIQAGSSLTVNAFAGTGKSSTLRYVCNSLPEKKFLYLVFGSAQKAEAALSFPTQENMKKGKGTGNCVVSTVHGLAYGKIINSATRSRLLHYWDFAQYSAVFGGNKQLTTKVVSILREYCKSDKFSIDDIRSSFDCMSDDDWATILPDCQKVWSMLGGKNNLPVTHDWYQKVYQLSKPVISGFDVILIDEAQDLNPVQLDIIRRQKSTQKVFVGDRYQGIYAWRGAINAMSEFSQFKKLYLTESFRFSQDIADGAGLCLAAMGESRPLIGRGNQSEINQTGYLVRSNAGLFELMLNLASSGIKFYPELDTSALFRQMYTASAMRSSFYAGLPANFGKFPDKQIMSFGDWQSLKQSEEPDIKRIVRLCEKGYGHSEISLIKDYLQDKPGDTVIVSGHKSKGLEYDKVVINDDFLPYDYQGFDKSKIKRFIDDQGLNLLYVGLTRAKVSCDMGEGIKSFLNDLITHKDELKNILE